eukprot:g41701.t1
MEKNEAKVESEIKRPKRTSVCPSIPIGPNRHQRKRARLDLQQEGATPPYPCGICGKLDHSTPRCYVKFLPTVCICCEPAKKSRLEAYLQDKASNGYGVPFSIVDSEREHSLVFLQSKKEDAQRVMDALWEDKVLHRAMVSTLLTAQVCRDRSFLASLQLAQYTGKLRVMVYPAAIKTQLIAEMPENTLAPRAENAESCLFVVLAYHRYHYQIAPAASVSTMLQVLHDVAVPKVNVCRAYYKLEELFDRRPGLLASLSPCSRVLDIGASPGGWSLFMARQGHRVLSVDPGQMKLGEDINPDEAARITHVAKKIEESDQECKAASPFQAVVCDMNCRPS